jgi:hypothetical protein
MTATTTHTVGERTELARYTLPAGGRVISGQRIDGTVRFLLGSGGVLAVSSRCDEDSRCRSRRGLPSGGRRNAVRPKRPNGAAGAGRQWADQS